MTTRRPVAPRPRRLPGDAQKAEASPAVPRAATPRTTPRNATGATAGRSRAAAARTGPVRRSGAQRRASRPGASRPARAGSGPGRVAVRIARDQGARGVVVRPATVAVAVVVLLALVVAPYLRPWVAQRAQLAQTRSEILGLHREIDQLAAARARWDDDAYVRAQARQRLRMVMPGELSYTVLNDISGTEPADPRQASVAVPEVSAVRPWYATLWGSMRTAGDRTTRQEPAPDVASTG